MQCRIRQIRRSAAGCASGWQRLAIAFTILAFAFQSYAVGSHVHPLPSLELALPGVHHTGAPSHPPKSDDPDTCPLCQAMVLYGSYVLPGAIALAPPDIIPAAEIARRPAFSVVAALSHDWQSRAPPRV